MRLERCSRAGTSVQKSTWMMRSRLGLLARVARGAAAAAATSGIGLAAAASSTVPNEGGGVLLDYKKKKLSPRAVTPLSPPRDEFFSKEIVALGLPIRAHASVSDAALVTAADRLSRMLRYLPP